MLAEQVVRGLLYSGVRPQALPARGLSLLSQRLFQIPFTEQDLTPLLYNEFASNSTSQDVRPMRPRPHEVEPPRPVLVHQGPLPRLAARLHQQHNRSFSRLNTKHFNRLRIMP